MKPYALLRSGVAIRRSDVRLPRVHVIRGPFRQEPSTPGYLLVDSLFNNATCFFHFGEELLGWRCGFAIVPDHIMGINEEREVKRLCQRTNIEQPPASFCHLHSRPFLVHRMRSYVGSQPCGRIAT